MKSTPLCAAWSVYLSYQTSYDPHIINARALGREEMMGEIINLIEREIPLDDASIARIERNRARKFHNQQRILFERIANFDAVADAGTAAYDKVVAREKLDWVLRHTTKLEWDCLWGLAIGDSYQEISERVALKASTLRSLVSRCRSRLLSLSLAA